MVRVLVQVGASLFTIFRLSRVEAFHSASNELFRGLAAVLVALAIFAFMRENLSMLSAIFVLIPLVVFIWFVIAAKRELISLVLSQLRILIGGRKQVAE